MTVHAPVSMTKEAFLAWIDQREERYEFAGGRAVMMVHVGKNHTRVANNLILALGSRLSADQYDVAFESFAVPVGDSIRFPDIVVEPVKVADGLALETTAPILIAEILSPGTRQLDFGEKLSEYLSLPTVETYIILSPDEQRIWRWQRRDGGFRSEPDIIDGADDPLALAAFGIEIPLAEIFRGVS